MTLERSVVEYLQALTAAIFEKEEEEEEEEEEKEEEGEGGRRRTMHT
jgi:hypothetical protein